MQFLNEKLYIEFKDFLAAGWKENTLKSANQRNGARWQMVQNPTDKRMPMVEFEPLIDDHKEKLNAKFQPDVYSYIATAPIKALVKKDAAASAFYTSFRFSSGLALPQEHIEKYSTAASWLNMLAKLNADKKYIKKVLNLTIDTFFEHVLRIIVAENIGLPTKYVTLRRKMQQYAEGSYASLISGRFENDNSAKIDDETSQAALLDLIAHPNQYDDVMVCMMYNHWAKKNGYKEIEAGSVGVWRRKKEAFVMIGREGSQAFNEKYIRQVKGLKVSKVGYLWESDDYNINLYFQDGDNVFSRYVSYIVADSKTGLVLGKSYRAAQSPTVDMVRLAYIDAMYYVKEFTGGWHLPFEIKTDRWQQKTLFPFFESLANFTPPSLGNKHRGYIEQLFGSPHAKRAEKMAAHNEVNYNGNNMTARNMGVNVEALKANQKNRPLLGNASDEQVEKFFYLMRHMPAITRNNLEAPSKHETWLADWQTLTPEQKRPITDEQFLMLFGIKHQPQGRPITITNRGIEPQIDGSKYSYDLPEHLDMNFYVGSKVFCYYDPYDMSRILVTNEDNIRFIATTPALSPRALEDATIGSRAALNMILENKKQQVERVSTAASARKDLHTNYIDSEALMLGGFMPKELKNQIEYQALEYEDSNYNPLDDM